MNKHFFLKKYSIFLMLTFVTFSILIMIIKSPVSYTGSDPRASLLLSQTLIEQQSFKLDKYQDITKYGYAIQNKNNHFYYYFPIGTSISSIPFVFFENKIFNHDMNDPIHDKICQKRIAGIVCVIIFLLLYKICCFYFRDQISIIIAFIFFSGTSLSSTLGSALWSHDFASLYALLSIFLMLLITKNNKKYWILLGISLFMAYLTRPTMSLLSFVVISYLFAKDRKIIAIQTAVLVGILLGLFVIFSLIEFNQLLPDYYLPSRLSSKTFWIAFWGNLFSPARGLFIFSPFLLLFLISFHDFYNMIKQNTPLLILVSYILLHLIIISKFPHWWAGWSYGPRFMLDTLPVIFLLFINLLSFIYKKSFPAKKIFITIFLTITIPLSIYFNAIQGLYEPYTAAWNANPNIDKYPEYLFDWKYPQFIHNKYRNESRISEFQMKQTNPINLHELIKFDSKKICFINWSSAEKEHRWSLGKASMLKFKLASNKGMTGVLKLHIGTLGTQKITLSINDHYIENKTINCWDSIVIFNFDPNFFYYNDRLNTIKFKFSNAHKPNNGDQRILAMALKSFMLE